MEQPSINSQTVRLTVIAPAHNEEDNIAPLVEELRQALTDLPGGFEVVVVDDGSTDETRRHLLEAAAQYAWLRVLAMTDTPPGRGNGQSAAFEAGPAVARLASFGACVAIARRCCPGT